MARAENLLAAVFLPLGKMLLKHKNNIKHISASSSSSRSLALFFLRLTLRDESSMHTFVRERGPWETRRRRMAFIMSIGSNHLSREMGISVFSLHPHRSLLLQALAWLPRQRRRVAGPPRSITHLPFSQHV
jgi:hypothetical protein